MPFPWGQSCLPIKKQCQHCGSILEQSGHTIAECSCPESEQARLEERERMRSFQAARRPTFDEARQKNKRPVRDDS